MAEHILIRSFTVDLPRKEVFDFFAEAKNLEQITPPELNFHIVTPSIELKHGTLIDYRLKLYGLPITWKTEISVWNPPHSFTDRALKSPYKKWIHRHTFQELSETKTSVEDEVRYRLPFEPLGEIAHWFVRRELEKIFDFREKAVAEILHLKGEKN